MERYHAMLLAPGAPDLHAIAAFYDLTAPVVFGMLHGASGRSAPAERATEDVYLQLWLDAPTFDATVRSAWATVMAEAHRVLARLVHDRAAASCHDLLPSGDTA